MGTSLVFSSPSLKGCTNTWFPQDSLSCLQKCFLLSYPHFPSLFKTLKTLLIYLKATVNRICRHSSATANLHIATEGQCPHLAAVVLSNSKLKSAWQYLCLSDSHFWRVFRRSICQADSKHRNKFSILWWNSAMRAKEWIAKRWPKKTLNHKLNVYMCLLVPSCQGPKQ